VRALPPLPRIGAAALPGGGAAADYHAVLSSTLNQVADSVDGLTALVGYLGPGSPPAPPGSPADLAGQAAAPRLWRPDRERLVHALKVAVILVTTLWLWMTFHLPSGMQAMVSATLVAQRTIGATMLKGGLRLAGALAGGTIGILVAALALPALSELWVFGLLIAPMIFACAWLNDSSKRYGYLGFQTGFAFLLTLVAGDGPQPAPMAPLMRAVGVVLGVGVAALLLRTLAPVDAWTATLRHLAALLDAAGRALAGRAGEPPGELTALRDRTAAYVVDWQPAARRRGWPAWPLRQVFAQVSQLAALAVATRSAADSPELAHAAAQLEKVSARCATALRTRCATAGGGELAMARAALEAVSRTSDDVRVQARVGALRTAATLLAQLEEGLALPTTALARRRPYRWSLPRWRPSAAGRRGPAR
ncbi:MAG: FUSC family protein, partial [Candidatus Binatia bacterium]